MTAPATRPATEDERLGARRLGRVSESVHSVSYYGREIHELTDRSRVDWKGYKSWWQAYFAYRAAPLGAIGEKTATAIFYNFAPRMVARSIPQVWEFAGPAESMTRRDELVDRALVRTLGPMTGAPNTLETADLLRSAMADVDVVGRPLFAAHMELPWPDEPHLAVWHGCTLLRELRGDSHIVALTSAEIDGCQSHLLMTAQGTGNKATIQKIRGWNDAEWETAAASLQARGWLTAEGSYTDAGRAARRDVERHTDRMASRPVRALGEVRLDRLEELLAEVVRTVMAAGEVPGVWPPPDLTSVGDG
ncbi:MAG: hypothetical protein ACI8Y4_004301 [Candidatus Poriferisodalaceae bacterium]